MDARRKVSATPPKLAAFHQHRKVDVRLPGKGNSNSHGARPVHLIITMITWIRTSRLSITNSLSDLNEEAEDAGVVFVGSADGGVVALDPPQLQRHVPAMEGFHAGNLPPHTLLPSKFGTVWGVGVLGV